MNFGRRSYFPHSSSGERSAHRSMLCHLLAFDLQGQLTLDPVPSADSVDSDHGLRPDVWVVGWGPSVAPRSLARRPEFHAGLCYEKCALLTGGAYVHRQSPWTCCNQAAEFTGAAAVCVSASWLCVSRHR